MSAPSFESKGIVITNEAEFRTKVCGTCKHMTICSEWEFETMRTLYSNINRSTKEPLKADDGTEGVYRCASYSAGESED